MKASLEASVTFSNRIGEEDVRAPVAVVVEDGDPRRRRPGLQWGGFNFTDVTEKAGVRGLGYTTGAAVGDFDNDGHEDLFVAGVQRNQLLRNAGNGTFTDVTGAAGVANYTWSVAAGWLDYDNDGWLDLFVVNYVDWTPETNKFCGDHGRDLRVYCHPKHYRGLANALYRNRHDGTFEDVSGKSRIGASIGKSMSVALPTMTATASPTSSSRLVDLDNDGWKDLVTANSHANDRIEEFEATTYRQTNRVFRNNGTRFEDVSTVAGQDFQVARANRGNGVGDFDADGRLDLVTTVLGDRARLLRNVSPGTRGWITLKLVGRASNRTGSGRGCDSVRRPTR